MDLPYSREGGVLILEVPVANLDFSNVEEFRAALGAMTKGERSVVLNLSKVEFVDSSGCGALVSCHRQLATNKGRLRVFGVNPAVRTLFQLVRLHRVIDVAGTRSDAIAACQE